jgi:hypothetical protein
MMPQRVDHQAPIPPPAYHRAEAKQGPALHIDAVTLVQRLHVLALCRLAVRLAQWRCPPPFPAGPGGAPRVYREESLVLIALMRTLWRLSYQDMAEWLRTWPALALACGLPVDQAGRPQVPCASQQWKRAVRAGAPLPEALFVLTMLTALGTRLIGAHDIIIDSVNILAWRRADPDAAVGHAPAQHPCPLLRGYRVHTLLCRRSGLPLFFLLSPESAPRCPLRSATLSLGGSALPDPPTRDPSGCRLLGPQADRLDPGGARSRGHDSLEPQTPEKPFLLTPDLDQRGAGQTQFHRVVLWARVPLFSSPTPSTHWLVLHSTTGCLDLHGHDHCRFGCPAGRSS